ncbi:tumor necrosis factor receptor superfamily member 5 isoform X1 [Hippocampus comes]|uniref:tumor necrosis factor receptor superfamily member 5 isoform X1 n=1 Tax=Hippocampus comes TaxID=109280 RepID=UPI00094EE48C|nr:PREDICTED: tumor necrosis factor receptor superfamily member 5-like isoform X1 [Hippocampus comes]XP_019724584.1 PREDICTED: tumor necrosis factor receptor superfamily member 5-like isoform X1 [Hippocampus comes]XP_019724586.1 PREDICTED: tumor necrosis factor receptor superfamily member 5-like isoform X1 [Hippocampus comes]XP_019724587.1 PREDICTED: tumor necrosis factor receptor superfamily member 5-like isoform X1 [Hippocampus comes]XP_019724588.1 PREDICTED: tumor necrosis factor receptor su
MADAKCNAEKYLSRAGRCCDRCPAGSFVRADCDRAAETRCDACGRGLYTATRNHLTRCRVCKSCSASNNQMTAEACAADKDTVCKCVSGFFCSGDPCDHCMPATSCPLGSGVKVQSRPSINLSGGANDTICTPCGNGTYSNVSDSHSACQSHTRCEDLGRVLKTAGTSTADAICGDFKTDCPWILPAGLWLGFVLTILVVLGLMSWKAKCKSIKTARTNVAIPEERTITESLVKPSMQTHKTFDQSEMTKACQFTLLDLDESAIICRTEHNRDLPLTLQSNSSDQRNGTDAYHRSHLEPQENEWCGT